MSTDRTPPTPPAVTAILEHLRADFHTGADPLEVRPDDRLVAVGWVRTLLLAPLARPGYFALAAGVLAPPAGTDGPLDADRAIEAATEGPDALTDAELARLLWSPRALDDLGRLLYELVPDWWEAEMLAVARAEDAAAGRGPSTFAERLRREEADRRLAAHMRDNKERNRTGPGAVESAAEVHDWNVSIDPEAARRVAVRAFGPEGGGTHFALTLHRVGSDRFDLEMRPAPRVDDVSVRATFPGETEPHTFLLRVPTALRVAGFRSDDVPAGVRADPCDALVEEGLTFGAVALRADGDSVALAFEPRTGEE